MAGKKIRLAAVFKWTAPAFFIVLLLVVGAALWLRIYGAPSWVLRRIERRAQARGLDLRLDSARWSHWGEIQSGPVRCLFSSGAAQVSARSCRIEFRWPRRPRWSWRLLSITLQDLNVAPAEPQAASWASAPMFRADFDAAGGVASRFSNANLLQSDLDGSVRIQNWRQLQFWNKPARPRRAISWEKWVRQFQFEPGSALQIRVEADGARHLVRSSVELRRGQFSAPWFRLGPAQIALESRGSASNSRRPVELSLSARTDRVAAPKAGCQISNLAADARFFWAWTNTIPQLIRAEIKASEVAAQKFSGRSLSVRLRNAATNFAAAFPLPIVLDFSAKEIALAPAQARILADRDQSSGAGPKRSAPRLQPFQGHAQARTPNEPAPIRFIEPRGSARATLLSPAHWPERIDWAVSCAHSEMPGGAQTGPAQASGQAAVAPQSASTAAALPKEWAPLGRVRFSGELRLADLVSAKLSVQQLQASVAWESPKLRVAEFKSRLYGGFLDAAGDLDAVTRRAVFDLNFQFETHRLAGLLTARANHWLSQFSWTVPPRVQAQARVTLPPWSERHPRWHDDVLPALSASGQFRGAGAFRHVPCLQAASHFYLTNLVWTLPDLRVERPEGISRLSYRWHMQSQKFRWQVDSQIDPRALKPLVPPRAQNVLDQLQITRAPIVRGVVQGRFHHPEETQFAARVQAESFSFRGEKIETLEGAAALTNQLFYFRNVRARRGAGRIFVPEAALDLSRKWISFADAVSTFPPEAVARIIGPHTARDFAPYRFASPPRVVVNGFVPIVPHGPAHADFEVRGESFEYWKFRASQISAHLRWIDDALFITNLQASAYGGTLDWAGQFYFFKDPGARMSFSGRLRRADLHLLMNDLMRTANHVRGRLDSDFTLIDGRTHSPGAWTGFADATLRDGYLWDIPLFGFFSPMLNTILPGLGESAISSANAHFTLEDSAVRTDDLTLRSPVLRLDYSGLVRLDGRVDARMTAEILRDAWVFGRVFSTILWPLEKAFEFKITGDIFHPVTEPVYIPKVFLMPLHPLRSLKKLFSHPPAPAERASGLMP